jgi:hypothetical protein
MKTELLNLGYAPVPHKLSNETICVGVVLPLSRHPDIVSTLISSISPKKIDSNHQTLELGKDLLLFWPNIAY